MFLCVFNVTICGCYFSFILKFYTQSHTISCCMTTFCCYCCHSYLQLMFVCFFLSIFHVVCYSSPKATIITYTQSCNSSSSSNGNINIINTTCIKKYFHKFLQFMLVLVLEQGVFHVYFHFHLRIIFFSDICYIYIQHIFRIYSTIVIVVDIHLVFFGKANVLLFCFCDNKNFVHNDFPSSPHCR